MTFEAERARAAGHVISRLGTPATYSGGGGEVPVRVILRSATEEAGEYGTVVGQIEEVRIPTATVPSPDRGDRLLIGQRSVRLVSLVTRSTSFTTWKISDG